MKKQVTLIPYFLGAFFILSTRIASAKQQIVAMPQEGKGTDSVSMPDDSLFQGCAGANTQHTDKASKDSIFPWLDEIKKRIPPLGVALENGMNIEIDNGSASSAQTAEAIKVNMIRHLAASAQVTDEAKLRKLKDVLNAVEKDQISALDLAAMVDNLGFGLYLTYGK